MDKAVINHSEKVLVFEADADVEAEIADLLTSAGYRVSCSPQAESAAYDELQPDMIIIDLELPHPDIIAFITDLNERSDDCPVIVLSHEGIEDRTVDALRLNVTDYMLKPLRKEVVLFSVHSSLERARLARENRKYREQLEATNRELKVRFEEIQADQQAGRVVQEKMLPPTPYNLLGFHFEHIIIPANYLAGDFVDYHQVSDNKLVFFLVDVIGHGASSAFVTVLMKQLTMRSRRQFEKDHHHKVNTAAWMLQWINKNLLEMELDRHLTIFLGVIDTADNSLNYCYGGHFPPVILCSEEGTRFLEGRGLPVGLFEDAQYEDQFVELPEAFSISAFSDGVLEILPHETLAQKEEYLLGLARQGESRVAWYYEQFKLEELDHAPDDISVFTVCKSADHG